MRIGTLGNGLMAEALASQWVKAGHDVMVGGRSADKAAEVAKRAGATAGTLQEAAAYGDVVLLAVPADVAVSVAGAVPAGTTLIDCTNALDHRDFTLAQPATAEAISRAVPEVRVVKAFNLAADAVWRNPPAGLGVPICGDSGVDQVAELVRDLGCTPVLAGGLRRAKLLEATAALAIGIWVGGGDVREMFPPLAAAFGDVPPGQP
ncbi:NADPH-dependent F420 reductase [Kribbella speibonae]|uniref:NADP oxidoreductase n=1 Tax=Kribbella speibonae TaxID=1572660 RepID=A0A4R0IXH5_9ACTN|nr:NAD(P)-binding domain-containing protein [Kribbella speibonae]TCC25518.1 NADP oxidoreductase [Kribbella speibonae]TCC37640.1 NADP oxidoreductase [Kribbella speibonae]